MPPQCANNQQWSQMTLSKSESAACESWCEHDMLIRNDTCIDYSTHKWFKSALRGKTNAFRVDGSNFIDLARYLEDTNSTYTRIITNETRRFKSLKFSLAVQTTMKKPKVRPLLQQNVDAQSQQQPAPIEEIVIHTNFY